MEFVFYQWLFFFIVTLIVLPKTVLLWNKFPDFGYPFSKILGWVVIGYLVWLFGSLHLISYGILSFVTASLVVLFLPPLSLINVFNGKEKRNNYVQILKKIFLKRWKAIILYEIIFLILLSLYSLIRAYRPDIYGAEKMMDFAFLQSSLKSVFFPPLDPWYSGGYINYYYFGYYLCSLPMKIFSIPPEIGYNISIASIASLVFILSFSICFSLTKKYLFSLIGTLALILLGNYDGIRQIITGKEFGSIDIWKSSRVIDKTINEFPSFSVLFADLHGHLMAIPIVLLFISLSLALYLFLRKDRISEIVSEKHNQKLLPYYLVFISLFLGVLFITNIWDFPIYSVFLLLFFILVPEVEWLKQRYFAKIKTLNSLPNVFSRLILYGLIILLSLLFVSPFFYHYHGQQQGIRFVKHRSLLIEFVTHYGFFLLVIAFYWWKRFKIKKSKKLLEATEAEQSDRWMFYFAFILLMLYVIFQHWVIIILLLLVSLNFQVFFDEGEQTYFFTDLLLFAGIGLLFACEVIYIKDFYGGQPRMNTVFKFGYQAWIMLSLAIAPMLKVIFTKGDKLFQDSFRVIASFAIFISIVVLFVFPVFGTYSYSHHFKTTPNLDGTLHIKKYHIYDEEAINWLKKLNKQKILLEAPGDSYKYHNVYSTFSGNISVLGWQQHEALWRDWTWNKIKKRAAEIRNFYNSNDSKSAKRFLNKYKIDYIVFGPHERKEYGEKSLKWLKKHYILVFQRGNVSIFRVR